MTRLAVVTGTGRCGSTLLQEVLARHEDVGFLSNLDDRLPLPPALGRLNGPLLRALPPGATVKGRARFAPSEGYRALAREVSPLLVEPPAEPRPADLGAAGVDRLGAFFARRASAQGRPLFLHKFTGYPRAAVMRAAVPGTAFVHVVREGHAVVESWLRMPWWRGHLGPVGWHFGPLPADLHRRWEASGRSAVVLAGLGWRRLVDVHEQARRALPTGTWLDVRYEDLLAEPRRVLATVTSFLGLDWTPAFARQVDRVRLVPPGHARRAFVERLGPGEAAHLAEALAPGLALHGYA